MKYLYCYLLLINLFAVFITARDKNAAVKNKWRVKELTLMLITALGGGPAMYLTMLIIHHKTRKPLFMIGIPLIIVLELILLFLVIRYGGWHLQF